MVITIQFFNPSKMKRNSRIELEQGYMDSTVGQNYNPISWLVKIVELEKGVIIWLHRKELNL